MLRTLLFEGLTIEQALMQVLAIVMVVFIVMPIHEKAEHSCTNSCTCS